MYLKQTFGHHNAVEVDEEFDEVDEVEQVPVVKLIEDVFQSHELFREEKPQVQRGSTQKTLIKKELNSYAQLWQEKPQIPIALRVAATVRTICKMSVQFMSTDTTICKAVFF